MSAKDHLSRYADGWMKGDLETILSSVSSDFVFDDPNEGQITKEKLPTYMGQLFTQGCRVGNSIHGAFRDSDPGGGRWADGVVQIPHRD